jgi:hypothetical protein
LVCPEYWQRIVGAAKAWPHHLKDERVAGRSVLSQECPGLAGQFSRAAEQAIQDQGAPDVAVQAVFGCASDPAQDLLERCKPTAELDAVQGVRPGEGEHGPAGAGQPPAERPAPGGMVAQALAVGSLTSPT